MSNDTWIVDVDERSFEDVVRRSRELPVLIDFWATWCAPCKTLGPILEKLARELAGGFLLAKVDVDACQELAGLFQIQSVPTVLLVKDGRPIDGFTGALPEAQIRQLLAPHLATPTPSALDEAAALEEQGRNGDAAELLRAHLREHTGDDAARVALARCLLADEREPEARKVFEKVGAEALGTPAAQAVAARLELLAGAGDLGELSAAVERDGDDLAARLAYGRALVARGRSEEGLEQLYQAALRDLHYEDDAPRKALIEAFQALGQGDPLTLDYQQRLSVLLCS